MATDKRILKTRRAARIDAAVGAIGTGLGIISAGMGIALCVVVVGYDYRVKSTECQTYIDSNVNQ